MFVSSSLRSWQRSLFSVVTLVILMTAATMALSVNYAPSAKALTFNSQATSGNTVVWSTGFESGQPAPTWTNTADNGVYPAGGLSNVGGICCGLSGPELGIRSEGYAHGGTTALLYSGMDNSATSSYAYLEAFDLSTSQIALTSTSELSYWIYPQSSATNGFASGSNSTCVAVDLIFTDGTNLRDTKITDENGNQVHPAHQCAHLALDTWNHVTAYLGSLSGKTLARIDVGYDQPTNTGGYRGYIDDIAIGSNVAWSTGFESGQPAPTWTNTADSGVYPAGGLSNVGGVCCGLSGPELGVRSEGHAYDGTAALLYSGMDNSATSSYAYLEAFDLSTNHIFLTSTSELSYWIYPQSSTANGFVSGSNSTCVAVDLVFTDGTNLRDSGVTDENGNQVHPAHQCAHLALDTWNLITANLGSLSGKMLARIDVGYDQPANTGGYRGYIDGIAITQGTPQSGWVGTWATSPQALGTNSYSNVTLREIEHTSVAGTALRIRLDNTFGDGPLTFTDVHVGLQGSGAAIQSGTDQRVTFGGNTAITLPKGGEVFSDPISLTVPAQSNLAVSLYLPGTIGQLTGHSFSDTTSYVSTAGDSAADGSATAYTTTIGSWYWLNGIDVLNQSSKGTIVAFGDSITDGVGSAANQNHRWPDYLAQRLLAASGNSARGVENEGIGGNELLVYRDCCGTSQSGLIRMGRDVIAQSNVTTVILLLGTNDIGNSQSSSALIAGYQQVVAVLHAYGIKVIGGTITPFGQSGYDSTANRSTRDTVNQWIRTSNAFDGIIDFDQAVRDPANPQQFLAAYDSGDHLHPSDAGYQAMGNAINLSML
jgi:lysophospholipase L1-like esterase